MKTGACIAYAVATACLLGLFLAQPSAARVHRRLLQGDPIRPSPESPSSKLCAVEGPAASSTWMNASSTCLKLYSSGAPIKAPADSATTKWGQIFVQSDDSSGATAVFIDRNGTTYPISASANPPTDALELERIWTLLVVRAELSNGNVTSFTPVLYVPYSTIMATMVNTQFEGTLQNTNPRPVGPAAASYFRWTFGNNITVTNETQKYGTLLQGTFDNLFTSVKDSKGKCQPALCADPTRQSAACKYYIQYFGNSTAMTLNWDPNMHMAADTELVPMFTATHRQYMASFIELYSLMQPYSFVPRNYAFFGHGTPMGVPENFIGLLSPATPVITCKY